MLFIVVPVWTLPEGVESCPNGLWIPRVNGRTPHKLFLSGRRMVLVAFRFWSYGMSLTGNPGHDMAYSVTDPFTDAASTTPIKTYGSAR